MTHRILKIGTASNYNAERDRSVSMQPLEVFEIAIKERRYLGRRMPPGRVVATVMNVSGLSGS